MKNMLWWLLILATVAAGLLLGITLTVGPLALAKFLLYCLGAIGVLVLLSLRIIGPDEMAVLVIFSQPVAFRNSGIRFVPFLPACYLRKYPKKVFNFSYPERVVVSMAGEHK